jgi:hypothetical protein
MWAASSLYSTMRAVTAACSSVNEDPVHRIRGGLSHSF